MAYELTNLTTADAFDLEALKERARAIDDDEALSLLARAAALEVESYCGLALLAQQVTATVHGSGGSLPVGPFWADGLPDHPVTVKRRSETGALEPIAAGWWIEGGRYPAIRFTRDMGAAPVVVSYPAGYGLTAGDIPHDLALAVIDQAARLYDLRGPEDGGQGLSPAAARICARYRRVRS